MKPAEQTSSNVFFYIFAKQKQSGGPEPSGSTMNYPKKPGFNLYKSRHCASITYSVKTWFLKILFVATKKFWCETFADYN